MWHINDAWTYIYISLINFVYLIYWSIHPAIRSIYSRNPFYLSIQFILVKSIPIPILHSVQGKAEGTQGTPQADLRWPSCANFRMELRLSTFTRSHFTIELWFHNSCLGKRIAYPTTTEYYGEVWQVQSFDQSPWNSPSQDHSCQNLI